LPVNTPAGNEPESERYDRAATYYRRYQPIDGHEDVDPDH